MTHTIDNPDLRNDPAARDPQCEGGSWCRCPVSTPCVRPAGVTHPAWCAGGESDVEAIHYSARLYAEPDGPSMVRLSVQAYATWPHPEHPDLPPQIEMTVQDEGEERHHFLPLSQVRDLIANLQLLLGQVES